MSLVVVTAADRAAATVRSVGDEPLRPPMAGTSPFRGGFAGSAAKRLPPRREPREHPLRVLNMKNPMAITIGFLRALTPHVRGGSVSRRGLTQAHRSRIHLTGGTTYAETHNSNASRFPGGSAKRGKTAIAASGG